MSSRKKIYDTVTIITENSLQSSLLKDSLEKSLNINIDIIAINNLSIPTFSRGRVVGEVVIIDVSVFNEEKNSIYALCRHQFFPKSIEVLINCDKSCKYTDLKHWSDRVGVFYHSDDISRLSQGIGKILCGEMWFSRKLAQEYIQYFRGKNKIKTSGAYCQLTKREQQIIKLLGNGDSNVEIADKLFVSENTVKTHLHNVFRKINAKNRLQALIWAKENIGIEEFN